jgi:outer membrane protein assembly factor BamB
MVKRLSLGLLAFAVTAVCLAAPAGEGFRPRPFDWPQWQGPDRMAVSHEAGLLKSWPADGPPVAWKVKDLGAGYSTPSVAAGRVFGMSFRGKDEVVWAVDEANGKELWATRIAEARPPAGPQGNQGSRCTPTVDGDRVYALGMNGDLVCLKAADGHEEWHKNLVKDFGGSVPRWGYSESPLIDGEKLICTPGGKTATLVALDKKTGDTIWKAPVPEGDGAAYSSVIAADVDGQRQYVQFLKGGVVGIAAADGKYLWRYNKPSNRTANCSTPIYQAPSLFAASGYGTGGGLVKLVRQDGDGKAEEVYFTKDMKNQHGGMVLVDGYLYGANDPDQLVCLDFKTGKEKWRQRAGKGSIAYADGRLYYRVEKGPIVLVEANPEKYVERGRFDQPERSKQAAWPHPVIANGKLYIRDQGVLLCFDVKQQ